MKRWIILSLCMFLLLPCLTGCFGQYKENTWYSQEKLRECLVPGLPAPENRNYVCRNDVDIYVFQNSSEQDAYVQRVYSYLLSRGFAYFGTRGQQIDTLAGALTSYEWMPAEELSDFYVDGAYRFIFSDGGLDEYGKVRFYTLVIDSFEAQVLEYGRKKMTYNVQICLRADSETALNGFYQLPEV